MAARTARCAALRRPRVVWICVGLLQHTARAARASSYLWIQTTNIKGRAGRFSVVNEHRVLRKYTFELSQIRFS